MLSLLVPLAGCSSQAPPAIAPPVVQPPENRLMRAPSGTPDWVVDCLGTGDFTTISAAMDAASDRQWIEVLPCTYSESLDYDGKRLWISSRDGSATTTLSGQGIDVDKGEGVGTALTGFTVRGATSLAVDVELAALYLQDVVFSNNSGNHVIQSIGSDLRMDGVIVDGSNSPWQAAVFADKGAPVITRSTIECGTGSALQADHGSFLVDWSTIDCGSGGANDFAFVTEHGVGRIQRTTLTGDIEIVTEDDHPDDLVHLENAIVRGDIHVNYGTFLFRNSALSGTLTLELTAGTEVIESSIFVGTPACAIDGDTVPGTVRNNDFFGPTTAVCGGAPVIGVDGNLGVDPLFVNALAGDLHLQAGSPLIDQGIPESNRRDPDGTRNDMGVYGGRFSLDGGW